VNWGSFEVMHLTPCRNSRLITAGVLVNRRVLRLRLGKCSVSRRDAADATSQLCCNYITPSNQGIVAIGMHNLQSF
jgi:hypothetical protein